MVFERTKAPQRRKEFLVWYDKETEWPEEHSYDDPAVTSPALRNWYEEMIKTFPNMNGPDAPDDELDDEDAEAHLTDYSIGHHVIYAADGKSHQYHLCLYHISYQIHRYCTQFSHILHIFYITNAPVYTRAFYQLC